MSSIFCVEPLKKLSVDLWVHVAQLKVIHMPGHHLLLAIDNPVCDTGIKGIELKSDALWILGELAIAKDCRNQESAHGTIDMDAWNLLCVLAHHMWEICWIDLT